MGNKYEPPGFKKDAFTCPNCSAYSKQDWTYEPVNETYGAFIEANPIYNVGKQIVNKLYLCKCQHCGYISFWYKNQLAWPLNSGIEPPVEEMPDDIKSLYNEASSIVWLSPKGACAILRLALQILCNRLANVDEKNKIDESIKILVENGLPKKVQQAMDIVRIVGNEAVHPGEINVDDNSEIAIKMFRLMNMIIEKMIIEPRELDELYNSMPDDKLEGIKKRDAK